MTDVPRLKLRLMTHPTVKPIPIVFGVFDAGMKQLGWVTLPEFYRAQDVLSKCGDPLPHHLVEEEEPIDAAFVEWAEPSIKAVQALVDGRLLTWKDSQWRDDQGNVFELTQVGERLTSKFDQPQEAERIIGDDLNYALVGDEILTRKGDHWEDEQGNTVEVFPDKPND